MHINLKPWAWTVVRYDFYGSYVALPGGCLHWSFNPGFLGVTVWLPAMWLLDPSSLAGSDPGALSSDARGVLAARPPRESFAFPLVACHQSAQQFSAFLNICLDNLVSSPVFVWPQGSAPALKSDVGPSKQRGITTKGWVYAVEAS